jgi:hypothetical protein
VVVSVFELEAYEPVVVFDAYLQFAERSKRREVMAVWLTIWMVIGLCPLQCIGNGPEQGGQLIAGAFQNVFPAHTYLVAKAVPFCGQPF